MPSLLGLPNELIVSVLSHLPLLSILNTCATCRRLHALYAESSQLQYLVELRAAGMIDNPDCTMAVADRLRILRTREKAWADLEPQGRLAITVPKTASSVYDVTPTAYFLGVAASPFPYTLGIQSFRFGDDPMATGLGYMHVKIGKQIVDFGTSVEEHDLLALVAM